MTRPALMTLLALTVCLCCNTAYSIDFITKDRFKSDAGGYKDYPFRVLFQKLAQSQGEEKKKIRTAIVEKQVFDRNMQKRVEAGTVSYQRSFGVVREISEDRLVLWDAQSQTARTFYTGLLAIPTLNPEAHEVSSFNLSRFAVVVYSMDDRVYQLEIGFPIFIPQDLELIREGSRNLLQWTEPSAAPKPVGYRVYVSGGLYQSIEKTAIRIPRKPDQADEYTVRAVYRHGTALVESEPSATVFDRVTASELAEKSQAEQAYALMLSSLNPASWENARRILTENLPVFSTRLDHGQQAIVMGLTRFFTDIDEGDRLGMLQPETPEHLTQALQYYEAAMETGSQLAPAVDVAFIASRKIQENQDRQARVAAQNRKMLARNTLTELLDDLTPSTWESSRAQLMDNKALLTAHLTGAELATVNAMLGFFAEIDAGDALVRSAGDSPDQLSRAAAYYARARQKAGGAAGVDATLAVIAAGKSQALSGRIAALRTQNRQALARQTYDEVVATLTADRWPEARSRLLSQRDLLIDGMDADRRATVEGLLRFFSDIDAGDSLSSVPEATVAQMTRAGEFYQSARQKAMALEPEVNVSFIAELKLSESQRGIDAIESQAQSNQARQIWAQVKADLTHERWPAARQQLFDNRQLLLTHLTPETRAKVNPLLDFFATIDAGDGMAGQASGSAGQMEQAMGFYEKARQQAQALAPEMAVGFIADMRINQGRTAIADMESRARQAQAQQTLDRILSEMTPEGWTQSRQMLTDNRDLLLSHCTPVDKETVQQLIAFFASIDAGDRFAAVTPVALADLERAGAFYAEAGAKAEALAGAVSAAFIVEQRRSENSQRISAMRTESQSEEAQQIFERALSILNPSQWTEARATLYDHREQLETHLQGEQRALFDRLIAFLSDIDRGDRFSSLTPPTVALLDNALAAYQSAASQADALSGSVALSFLTQPKIETVIREKEAMLASQAKARAERLYGQILEQLTPSQWKSARGLMGTHASLLQSSLDGERREALMALDRFFSEIEEGDRLGAIRPATRANMENAAMFYGRAETKAAALPASVDIRFLPKMRLNEIKGKLAAQDAYERRMADRAAQSPGQAPALLSGVTDQEAIKFALKDFKSGDYSMALKRFSQVYYMQIGMMRKKGMMRLQGVMGLPDKHRAEVVFLVELEAVISKSDSPDEFAMEDALQAMSNRILEGRGMWGVISQDRRDKMASRLENISIATEESG